MLKRFFSFILVSVMIFSFCQVFAIADEQRSENTNLPSPVSVINTYSSNKEITYTLSSQTKLYSFTNGKPLYTLYELLPYGYAILYNPTNSLMEANYNDVPLPIDETSSQVYFYGGPGVYVKAEESGFIDSNSLKQLSVTDIQRISAVESSVHSLVSESLTELSSSNNSTQVRTNITYSVEPSFFNNLTAIGVNTLGTCTIVAIQMLLSYYDTFISDQYIDSSYEGADSNAEDLHQLLIDYVYGTDTIEGKFIHETCAGFNDYFSDCSLPVCLNSEYSSAAAAQQKIISELCAGRPIVASMSTSREAPYDHSVIIYSVTCNSNHSTSGAVVTSHMGWYGSPETNSFVSSIGWFYESGYIDCNMTNHIYNIPVSGIINSRTYCICGAYTNNHNHEYTEITNLTENTHLMTCSCGYEHETAHIYGLWTYYNGYYHRKSCVCGAYVQEEHAPYWNPLTGKCSRCKGSGIVVNNIDYPCLESECH